LGRGCRRMRLGLGQAADSGVVVEHPLLGAGRVVGVRELGPHPDSQVEQTVDLMRERVREDAADPGFQAYAVDVVGGRTGMAAAETAWRHVKGVIQFHRDEELGNGLSGFIGGKAAGDTVEFIIRPREMARFVANGRACGDCDDFSMYLAGILEAVGVPCAFVKVAADERARDQYSHVYVRAYPDGEEIALDASHGAYPGWEVPNMYGKLRVWPVAECGGGGLSKLLLAAGIGVGAWYLCKEFAAA
jgi:hypothetical protein